MTAILLATIGTQGVLNVSHEMVRRLEAAGHEVVAVSDKDVGEGYAARGQAFRRLPTVEVPPSGAWPDGGRIGRRRRLQDVAAERLDVAAFEAVLDDVAPAVAIIEVEYHEWILAATTRGIPVIVLHQQFCTWFAPGSPPADVFLPTSPDGAGRVPVAKAWGVRALHRLRQRAIARLRESQPSRPTLLRAYARAIGFPRREWSSLTAWPEPFHYRTLPILSTTIDLLDTAQPRDGVVYCGPFVEADRAEQVSDEVATAHRRAVDAGRPLVLVTSTTMGDGRAADAGELCALAAALDHCEVLVGADVDLPADAPANLTVVAHLPVASLLPDAAVLVSHAGINSINEAVAAGVALVLRPGVRHDQPGTAARMAVTETAEVVSGDADAATVAGAVRRCLDDPQIVARTARLAEQAAALVAEQRLEQLVEAEIARGPRIRL